MQPMKCLVAFGMSALVMSGCGGSSASTTPSVTAVTTSVGDTTTSSTTPPPSSTSSTVAPTTTLPATTTTVATEDLIKQAVQDYYEAYEQCGAVPAICSADSFTAAQGRSRATVTQLAAGMAQQGLYFSTDLRGSYLRAESVTVISPTEATAIYCAYDAATVLGPAGPDGLPTVVNDEILNLRNEYRLYLEANVWLVGEQQEIQDLGQGNQCPPDN